MTEVANLINLIAQTANPQASQDASNRLLQILYEPEVFHVLIGLSVESGNAVMRRYALVFLKRIISIKGSDACVALVGNMEDFLCAILGQHGDQETLLRACDLVIAVAQPYVVKPGMWERLTALMIQLLTVNLSAGLYLMGDMFKCLSTERQDGLTIPLIRAFVESVDSPDVQLRRNAIEFFQKFSADILNPAALNSPEVIEAIKKVLVIAVQSGDAHETSKAVNLFCTLCHPNFDFFAPFIMGFVAFAIDVIKNREISIDIRVVVYEIIEDALCALGSFAKEALDIVLPLTVEACESEPAAEYYHFARDVFEMASIDALPEMVTGCLQLIAARTPATVQTGLFVLTCALENNECRILDFANELVALIRDNIRLDCVNVFREADALVTLLAMQRPEVLTPILDELVSVYLSKGPMWFSSITLILLSSNTVTSLLDTLVEAVFQVIGEPTTRGDALRLLASATAKCKTLDDRMEEVCQKIMTSGIAGDVEIRGDFLAFIGAFIKAAPRTIRSQTTTVFQMIGGSVTATGYCVNKEAVLCTVELFRRFPATTGVFSEQIFNMLWGIWNMEFQSVSMSEETERVEFDGMRSATLDALAWFCRIFATHKEQCLSVVMSKVAEDPDPTAFAAAAAIVDKSWLVARDNVPFGVLTEVVTDFGVGDSLRAIIMTITAGLTPDVSCDCLKCLNAVIAAVGTNMAPFASVVFDKLRAIVSELPSGELQGYALRCMTSLACTVDHKAIGSVILLLIERVGTSNISLIRNILASFRRLGSTHPTVIQDAVASVVRLASVQIETGTTGELMNEAVATVLLFAPDQPIEVAKGMFANLTPSVLEDVMPTILRAACHFFTRDAAAFATEMLSISVAAITARECVWASLGPDIQNVVRHVLQIPEDVILREIRFDERLLALIRSRA